MTYNAADRHSVRAAEKAAKLAEQNRRIVIATLCDSPAGRQYFWEELAAAHIFSSTFTDDPRRSAFLEGERNAGLRLLADITRFAPDQFLQMMREANGRDSTNGEQRRSPDGNGRDQAGSADSDGDDLFGNHDYAGEDPRGLD